MLLAHESILAPMLLALLSDMRDWKYVTIVDSSNCNSSSNNNSSSSFLGGLLRTFSVKYFKCKVPPEIVQAKSPVGGNFIWLLSNKSNNIINVSTTATMTLDETLFSPPAVVVTEGRVDWFEELYFRQDEEVYHIDLDTGTLSERFMIKNKKVN